uniref:Uncharacterized protein n=1 Tax=Haptolina brevifila TaxID=156173 RepID=A0A7S2IU36_9EUKA|eukprot:CAMPEP_0174714530 /NCGR_PEP_ID=MMETSP1094-20130205/18458_1 /TAXON_ID=156173 /ORGANISM="Chrysochromulina brevifilum, Strain UTEX LB 985" /LENGTH=170 /DNA_ID=CAMNT_0015913911 /DNA_START=426 /DNA_END=938 /DNA_ORIENTATION=-
MPSKLAVKDCRRVRLVRLVGWMVRLGWMAGWSVCMSQLGIDGRRPAIRLIGGGRIIRWLLEPEPALRYDSLSSSSESSPELECGSNPPSLRPLVTRRAPSGVLCPSPAPVSRLCCEAGLRGRATLPGPMGLPGRAAEGLLLPERLILPPPLRCSMGLGRTADCCCLKGAS